MTVTVTSAASSKKLTTLAEVKDDLGISVSTYDNAINKKIDQASAMIVSYCGREFAKETVSETMPGTGDYTLIFTRTPVISITSISYKGTAVDANVYELHNRDAGTVFNSTRWLDTALGASPLSFVPLSQSRENNYTAVYIAGYWLPSFSGSPSGTDILLPDDVELAARELAKMLYLGRRRDQSIKQETAANVGSVTYYGGESGSLGGLPPMLKEMLSPWRRFVL